MNPLDIFNQVKGFIERKDLEGAQKFIEEHKDELGEYLTQAQNLVKGNETISNALGGLKNLLG